MEPIKAELPDGTVLEFEAGTPDAVVDRVVKQHLAGGAPTPAADGAPTPATEPEATTGPDTAGFEKELGAYYQSLKGGEFDPATIEGLAQKYRVGTPTNLGDIGEFYKRYGTLNPRLQMTGPAAPPPPVTKSEDVVRTVDKAGDWGQRARAFGKGLLFDFNDELEAAARMVASGELSTDEYYRIKSQINSDYNEWAKANPEEALGLELAGGVTGAFIPGVGVVGTGMRGVRAGEALGSTFLAGARSGAISGGLSGLGQSETLAPSDVLPSVITGTGIGAGTGGVFGKGAELAGRGFAGARERVYQRLGKPSLAALPEERKAAEILYGATEGGKSPERAVGLTALSSRYSVPAPLGMATPELAALTEKFLAKPTLGRTGREAMARTIAETQQEAGARVASQAEAAMPGTKDYFAMGDEITARLRQIGDKDYAAAYAIGEVRDPVIEGVVKNPELASVWQSAQRLARLKGSDLRMRMEPVLDEGGNLVGVTPTKDAIPDVEALDYFKRALDDKIDAGFKGKSSTGKSEAAALKDLRNTMVGRLDDLVPEYKAARAKYAGDLEVRDALEFGRGLLSPKVRPQEVNKTLATMSDAEKEAVRSGALQAIFQPIEDAATNRNFAQQFFGSGAKMNKLKAIMSPSEFKFFERAMQREADLFHRGSKATGGSRTVPLGEGVAQLDNLIAGGNIEEAVNFILAGPQGRFASIARWVSNLQPGREFGEKVYNQLGKALSAQNPDQLRDVLDMLARSKSYANFVANTKRIAAGPVAGVAGNIAPSTVEDRSPNLPPTLQTGKKAFSDNVLDEARRAIEMEVGAEQLDGLSFEGVADEGNAPFKGASLGERNLNPGNIIDGSWARSQPGYAGPGEGGFARFETMGHGAAAQQRLIASKIRRGENTVAALIDSYLGGDPRNTAESTANYKAYVAKRLGINVNDAIPPSKIRKASQAMMEFETGNRPG